MRTLEVEATTFESKYLGLPTPEGRMKNEHFQPILNRFGKKCNDWNERFMSQARKEVNVKSTAQSWPTYVMRVFKLNQNFYKLWKGNSFDAEEICKIRILAGEVEDCVAWHYEKTGIFTIKIGYKLADNLKRNGKEAPSSSTS